MSNSNIDLFRRLINDTNSKYFTVRFRKKDGSIRTMRGQMNVQAYLRNKNQKVAATTSHLPHYIVVFEPSTLTYKNVNLSTMFYFRCGNRIVDLGEDFYEH